jgi:hypothetical protein
LDLCLCGCEQLGGDNSQHLRCLCRLVVVAGLLHPLALDTLLGVGRRWVAMEGMLHLHILWLRVGVFRRRWVGVTGMLYLRVLHVGVGIILCGWLVAVGIWYPLILEAGLRVLWLFSFLSCAAVHAYACLDVPLARPCLTWF